MKNKLITATLTLALIALSSGCQHTRRQSTRQPQTSKSDTYLKNAVANHDKKISELTFQLKHINDNNNKLTVEINKLIRNNADLNQKVTLLEKSSSILRDAIDAERNNRHTETERLLKEVAKQTTTAINTRTKALEQQKREQNSNTKGGPATAGSFYEYKVQPGATLGAIAKAYKVSVNDIKKANKLKSDIIHIGQKLYIPKR